MSYTNFSIVNDNNIFVLSKTKRNGVLPRSCNFKDD